MTIDNYAPCPCGSGKKMKYCKCVDQPQEYEKIVRFIEGGQELAAMDRVNQLLAKSPSSAWLLAIKAELAMALQEPDTLRETVTRFIKLKPDNPLALTMSAMVSLSDGGPVDQAVRTLLDGLAESRESLPSMVLEALQLLCVRLRNSRQASFRFFWVRLLERIGEQAQMLDGPVEPTGLRHDSLLSMSPVNVPPIPSSAAWSERANEVITLITGFRYGQAENKLRTILRDFPDQPWPLMQLLETQMVLLDQAGATTTARKLSGMRELSEATRDYFMALSFELEEKQASISPVTISRLVEVESDDIGYQALTSLSFMAAWDSESVRAIANVLAQSVGDEVPSKHVWNVRIEKRDEQGEAYNVQCGMVALLGRQTDKPTRVLINLLPLPQGQEMLDQIVQALQPKAELVDPTSPRSGHYLDIVGRRPYITREDGSYKAASEAQVMSSMIEDFLNLPFPALDNQTPLQAIEQEPKRGIVRALLTHLDSCHQTDFPVGLVRKLYERLNFVWPETDIEALDKSEATSLLQLVRCDMTKANDSQLVKLLLTGLSLQIQNLRAAASAELLKRPRTPELDKLRIAALQIQVRSVKDPLEALNMLEETEQLQAAQNYSVGETVMARFELLTQLGHEDVASQLLGQAFRKYPNDPHLASVRDYIMQQARGGGMVNEGQMLNRMSTRKPEADSSESGLVLPGQDTSSGESGKSKLWLPGS